MRFLIFLVLSWSLVWSTPITPEINLSGPNSDDTVGSLTLSSVPHRTALQSRHPTVPWTKSAKSNPDLRALQARNGSIEGSFNISLGFGTVTLSKSGATTKKTEGTKGVIPIPCHSHNDYKRDQPLLDALKYGCIGIEADVWQQEGDVDDLRIGHEKSELEDLFTLKLLYLDPIISRLESSNRAQPAVAGDRPDWKGLYVEKPRQSVTLLIDLKSEAARTWPVLVKALEPLRQGGWLSFYHDQVGGFQQRALTVVVSGTASLDDIESTKRRDMFLDCPLGDLIDDYDDPSEGRYKYGPYNCYYASMDFARLGDKGWTYFPHTRAKKVEKQVVAAKARGLKARYFNAPLDLASESGYPYNPIWYGLWTRGVGVLNTDHLNTIKRWFDSQEIVA